MTTETFELLPNSTQESSLWNVTMNSNINSTAFTTDNSIKSTTLEPEYGTGTDITDITEDMPFYPTTELYQQEIFDEYYYPGFPFERPIYGYIWEALVIATALVNIVVIVVLLRKKMRNPTNMILTAIAISDTLTGVVTLPTYIMAYQKFEPKPTYDESNYADVYYGDAPEMTTVTVSNATTQGSYYDEGALYPQYDAYALSKSLCTWFMLTKFFFSKMFHTVSIFLTLFLGFQRFVSVTYPFIANRFLTHKSTVITCVLIFIFSPILHIYHVVNEKAEEGMCEWKLENCEGDCAFLWIVLMFRHIIPCTLLIIFTALFARELNKSRTIGGNKEQIARRERENRRATIIVIAIVIVFLIPEIPYGIFLLVSVISRHINTKFDLEKNRTIHAVYEITLVTSFHANFYIYTFLNKRFRAGLKRTVIYPVQKLLGRPYRWSMSRSQSGRSVDSQSQRKTMHSTTHSSRTGTLLKPMNPDLVGSVLNEESLLTETKLTNGTSVSTDSKYE